MPTGAWLVHGAEIGIYGYIISGFFLSQAYSAVLYLLIALSVFSTRHVIESQGAVQSGTDERPLGWMHE
jgi:hypothetical protein